MTMLDAFFGPNAGYALETYERFRHNPDAVDAATRALFAQLSTDDIAALGELLAAPTPSTSAPAADGAAPSVVERRSANPPASRDAGLPRGTSVAMIVAAARLARSIREYGHLAAQIDPLGSAPPGDPMLDPATHGIGDDDLAALPASIVWPQAGPELGSCRDAISRLRALYAGTIGYEFDHIQDFAERAWLHDAVETGAYAPRLDADQRRDLLRSLSEVEGFELFLHTTFQGQKRFSLEGCDALVPMLDAVVRDAAAEGAREVLLGMAHRGRLNVLAHILRKPYAAIFAEFHSAPNRELVPSEGSTGINYGWTGDVKYHLGAERLLHRDELAARVRLTMAHNPSHLEFVNPVVEGFARAAQEQRGQPGQPLQDRARAVAVVVHGDAAFPGEGVVAETLNLSRLPGFETGGTLHIIANNQVGFTTEALDGRSTLYASDLAKGFEIPIIHVNADDPEACLSAVHLAHAFRTRFSRDVLIDLVGYRRRGHNEGDEPAYTQPRLYAAIETHSTARAQYAERLITERVVTPDEVRALQTQVQEQLRSARATLHGAQDVSSEAPLHDAPAFSTCTTAVPAERLRELNAALLVRPDGFQPHPRLEKLLQRRQDLIEKLGGIDWALGESLAFASILADGTPIRLTGQDAERGTFSQRHLVLHDAQTGGRYTPLQALPQARASFAIYNSPLSEAAVLGFEYGYSVHAPDALVLWEAQFGDFANAGQVLIDQFIAAARAKWRQHPSLVLLLPHGYEGQGPEHSSGRIERYLQLAAEDNLRVANCTSAAQYFHLLRAQAALLANGPRPLVLLTPKSLLRQPLAASSLADLAQGAFEPVRDDPEADAWRESVERLVLCSGKVAVDLSAARNERGTALRHVAVARVELLYPLPTDDLRRVLAGYPRLREIVWLQEEPRNMGAWGYIAPRLDALLPPGVALRYIGRPERASTAEGSADDHAAEQARILAAAVADEPYTRVAVDDQHDAHDQHDSAPSAHVSGRGARASNQRRGGQHVG